MSVSDLPRKEVNVLKGHEGAVLAARFNSDGNYCLSCGKDRTIRLWNPHRGIHIKTYKSHGREVRDVHVTLSLPIPIYVTLSQLVCLYEFTMKLFQQDSADSYSVLSLCLGATGLCSFNSIQFDNTYTENSKLEGKINSIIR